MRSIPQSEKTSILAALKSLEALVSGIKVRSCALCVNFSKEIDGFCDQWKSMVPEDRRPDGCKHWVDEIPF